MKWISLFLFVGAVLVEQAFSASTRNSNESRSFVSPVVKETNDKQVPLYRQVRRRAIATKIASGAIGPTQHQHKRKLEDNGDAEGNDEEGGMGFNGGDLFKDWGAREIAIAVGVGIVGLIILCCICILWSCCCCCC